ncbi:MAG: zinc ribbon domain-containing protein [Desulfurivibrionaceae bacterium]
MPVYEYECQSCQEVTEIWQNIADKPVNTCPSCKGPLKKIISMSSFRLKGGGWYADGYSSTPAAKPEKTVTAPECPKVKKACDSC